MDGLPGTADLAVDGRESDKEDADDVRPCDDEVDPTWSPEPAGVDVNESGGGGG